MAPSAGSETHTDPAEEAPGFGGGSGAGAGNGAVPLVGPCAISTVTVGQELGLGAGDGEGDGVGVVGVVTPPVDAVCGLPPQPASNNAKEIRKNADKIATQRRTFNNKGNHLRVICQVVRIPDHSAGCSLLAATLDSQVAESKPVVHCCPAHFGNKAHTPGV